MLSQVNPLYESAIDCLKKLISIPSFSKKEDDTAQFIYHFLHNKKVETFRYHHNIVAFAHPFDPNKKTIWLNSHHDTVQPNAHYTLDPFSPIVKNGKLYGLGSNDAGGSLVCLLHTFLYFSTQNIPFNLVFIASAEEEISGSMGIESILDELPKPEFVVVGEPTKMKMGVAEKGLIVLDVKAKGVAGHAARAVGKNAIYLAIEDINWFRNYIFPKISPLLGEIKMTVSQIKGGYQHNVIPDLCEFVVDIRTTEKYTNQEVIAIIKKNIQSKISPRSLRLSPSFLADDTPISLHADQLKIPKFGSETLSDQALIPYPSFKMGPGDSIRSHTPDEFIYLDEIAQGLKQYIHFLATYFTPFQNENMAKGQ